MLGCWGSFGLSGRPSHACASTERSEAGYAWGHREVNARNSVRRCGSFPIEPRWRLLAVRRGE